MAIYYSRGRISDMSEVLTGTSKSGNEWRRMSLTLEIPGYQGSVTKQVFQVFGDVVDDVLDRKIGDRVEVGWTMYAREWKGRFYNNVDLVNITDQEEKEPAKAQPKKTSKTDALNPASHEDDLPF